MFSEGSDRARWGEPFDEDGWHAKRQHHDDVVGAADVGVRERNRPNIKVADFQGLAEALPGGDQGLVGVEHALRV